MTGNMIGRVFNNRYKLTDRIGIGGMAEVYRAHDEVLGRVVAVKTMLPQYAADPSFTQRFKQEAAAAANLQSPYIVNVYDWGQDEGTYYIVMEYVRGSDLKTAIKERGAINQRKVAEIGAQVCQALSTAHNLDIIHRDIKPQNIMVQPDGNVKVMDFGIARAKNSVMTQTSSVLGTAHYISPEQAQGKDLTPASDIYSLGIVLYEAATGVLPFDGPDAVSVAMKQVNELPVMPHEYNPDLDPDFEDIIMKALSKRPVDRFATANDMRFALNDYLAGRPVNLGTGFAHAETAVLGAGMAGAGMAGAAIAGGMADGTAVMPVTTKPVSQNGSSTNYRAGDSGKGGGSNKKTIFIVIGIIAAIAIIAGIAWAVSSMGQTGDPVPDVKGQTVDAATKTLQDAGFAIGDQKEEYNSTVEAGKVVSQDPKAGDKAEKGTKVNLVISKGPEQVTVPDLTNKTADEAKKLLDDLGLKSASGTAEYSSTVPVNHIVRQDPAAQTTVNKGSTVTYYLSLGTESAGVPNVVGSSENDAINTLQSAGFGVGNISYSYSDNYDEGIVMDQNPKANAKVEKGSTVDLTVSQGPKPPDQVSVPTISPGTSQSNAETAIRSAGLVPDVQTAYSDTIAQGMVISQSPSGGTKVDKGSTVTIVVSDGPKPPSTP